MIKDKKILIGVSGSIAAYKIANLVRLLVKNGAIVKVIMTPASKSFVSPLTLSTLSKNPVLYELSEQDSWSNHVMLGRWADLFLIAPLSANTLAKMAHGLCDNLLLAVYLSATCPVWVAPAMDEDMWLHSSTRHNIDTLSKFGNIVIPVEEGELASGLTGPGRMAEPETLYKLISNHFISSGQLNNKRILITAGPTYEPVDPVRFIGNHSSGKMGIALAEAAYNMGADVTLVLGPGSEKPSEKLNVIHVSTSEQMYKACIDNFKNCDIAILAAAVADFRVANPSHQKIKKDSGNMHLELEPTTDILSSLGKIKEHQVLVGFALETNNEEENAIKKLTSKNLNYIVLNSLNDENRVFGSDNNKIIIYDKQRNKYDFGIKPKKELALDILNTIIKNEQI